jgi:CheY-like chemotaxis protein
MAVNQDHELPRALEERGFVVITAPTGQMTMTLARGARPDVLLLEQQLSDMSGVDAFAALRRDARLTGDLPVILLTTPGGPPVSLPAGVGNGLESMQRDTPLEDLARRIEETALVARMASGGDPAAPNEPIASVFTSPVLGWRARELGALMVRMHAALSCLVFSVDATLRDAVTLGDMSNAARTSDVVGPLGSTDIGVIAPVTGYAGAVSFARRMSTVLRRRAETVPAARSREVRVGFASVDNLKYSPVDPLELLGRAASAVNDGVPEPLWPWIRSAANGQADRGFTPDWT